MTRPYPFSLKSVGKRADIDTFVQLAFLGSRGLIAVVKALQSYSTSERNLADLAAAAERELGAFTKAVTHSFGHEAAMLAAGD